MRKSTSTAADRYLWHRPQSRSIWFRMAVPKEYRHRAGRAIIQCSLDTPDRRHASILAGELRAKLFRQWGELPALHVPTDHELEEAAVVIAHDLIRDDADAGRKTLRGKGPHMWRGHVNFVRADLETQARYAATGDYEIVRELADEAIEALDFDLAVDSDRYAKFCELLNTARLAALKVNHQRNLGDIEAETDSQLVSRVRERETAIAKEGEGILELFDEYIAERTAAKRKRPAGADQDRMVVDVFAEFVGRDRALSSIGYEDAKAFVDVLDKLPKSYKKRGDYRGLSVREAIAKGQRDGHPGISVITQQRYISTLAPFFRWLRSEKGGRRVKSNPFDGLNKDTSKLRGANPRPPFTAEQITKIVQSPLFTGFLEDGKEHKPGNKRADDWRYWLPLICLFTGARIGEVAQLHVSDIYRDHGIWCVELRDDDATGQRTKSGKSRAVALHSTLIAIGLLKFVERQKKRSKADGNPQLFPEMKPGPRGQYGDEPSDWWRDYLAHIGVKAAKGSDGFGSHSFRHTMADQLRAAGYLDQVFGPIVLGHSAKSVTGGYGQAQQGTPQMSQEMIERVRFIPIERGKIVEGGKPVDFSHLVALEPSNSNMP